MEIKIINPLRFRSLEEYERLLRNEIGIAALVPTTIVVNGKAIRNPEYETLPYELTFKCLTK